MPKEPHKSRKPSSPKPHQQSTSAGPLDAAATQAVQALLDQLATLSQQLRQSSERAVASQALSPIERQPSSTALAFAQALSTRRETDAADVALALAELSQQQALRKEARKALVRLRSVGIAPSFSVPVTEAAAPQGPRPFYM